MVSQILDYLGNPVPATARPEIREMGAVGIRDRWSEYSSAGLTPGRLTAIFREADYGYPRLQAELFMEMEEKDTHLATLLQTRKMAIMGFDWQVMPYSESAEDKKLAAFVDEKLRAIANLEEALLDLLDAIGKGYSVCEILWQIIEGQAVPRALRWIHPKNINFLNSLTPKILVEENLADGVDPKPWQVIFHAYKARSGFVLRAGVLREVAFFFLLKQYALKDWSIFNEVFGMPLRLGKYDPSASPADRQALKQALINLGVDAAGIISKSTEIEFVEAKGNNAGQHLPYHVMLDWCNGEMSKAILGQTLTTDTAKSTGTYAAAKVHEQVRQDLKAADCEALAQTLKMQLIRPLVGFNFGWDKPLPWIKFPFEQEEDLEMLSTVYKNLVAIGQPISQEHVSERFGVPLPEQGQTPLTPRQAGGLNTPAPRAGLKLEAMKESGLPLIPQDKKVIETQLALEELAAQAVKGSAAAGAKMVAVIKAHIESGKSLAEIRDEVLRLYPQMDVKDLAELIYQANMRAYMAGRGSD